MWLKKRSRTFLLILILLGSASCGSETGMVGITSTTQKLDFTKDINPIIVANCSDHGCHGASKGTSIVFEDSEKLFINSKAADRITRNFDTPGYMPMGKSLTPTDKQILLNFLVQ